MSPNPGGEYRTLRPTKRNPRLWGSTARCFGKSSTSREKLLPIGEGGDQETLDGVNKGGKTRLWGCSSKNPPGGRLIERFIPENRGGVGGGKKKREKTKRCQSKKKSAVHVL